MFEGRSCLVLGSAPDPTLPSRRTPGQVLLCVNCAGYSASRIDLPPPDVTFLRTKKLIAPEKDADRRALRGLLTRHLVLVLGTDRGTPIPVYEEILRGMDYRWESLLALASSERATIVRGVAMAALGRGPRDETKASSGIAAVCLALFLGSTDIVLSGFSLDSDGLSYGDGAHPRHHVKPDRDALDALRRAGFQLRTSEPRLAQTTGVPLAE